MTPIAQVQHRIPLGLPVKTTASMKIRKHQGPIQRYSLQIDGAGHPSPFRAPS